MKCLFICISAFITLGVVPIKHPGQSVTPDCHPCYCSNSSQLGLIADCSGKGINSVQGLTIPHNINVLLLNDNLLTTLKDRDFANYSDLSSLDVSNNSIADIEGSTFAAQFKLDILNLENNKITLDCIKNKTILFQNLGNLKTLRMNKNWIKSTTHCTDGIYPDEVFSPLKSLEALYIDGLPNATFGSGFSALVRLVNLTLSGNYGCCNINTIEGSTFQYLTQLEYLDISKCSINKIEPETFIFLPNIRYLDISSNTNLGLRQFGNITYGLQSSNISVLRANCIVGKLSCNVILRDDVKYLTNTSLTELHVDDNQIANIQPGALKLLPNTIIFISAQRNKFIFGPYLDDLIYLDGLREISISGIQFPMTSPTQYTDVSRLRTAIDEGVDVAAEADDDDDDHEDIHDVDIRWYSNGNKNIKLPPGLERIKSNFTQFMFTIGALTFQAVNLTYIDLSSNLIQFQQGSLSGLKNVTYLDLSNNLARKISVDLLHKCASLEVLNISYNFFGWQLRRHKYKTMFRNLFSLKKLHMAFNEAESITGDIFKDLHSLEVLNVSDNRIYNFIPHIGNLTKLKYIDCSRNQVMWLKPIMMTYISEVKTASPGLILNLSGNPLLCRCHNLLTLRWLLNSGVTPDDMTGYYCLLEDKSVRHITDKEDFANLFNDLENRCFKVVGLAFGTASCIILALCLISCGIIHRYRWKLRYMYYGARLKYIRAQSTEEEEDEFEYGAFVSYADDDRGFVINDMRSHLEREANIKLNIHHRDFMPGEPIASNIICAIQKSRKTLVLLSTNFLNSYWCRFELRMAQMESVNTGRDILLVVMYQHVPMSRIPPDLLHVLHSDTYLLYPQDSSSREVFWRQLVHSIKSRSHNG